MKKLLINKFILMPCKIPEFVKIQFFLNKKIDFFNYLNTYL